MADHDKTDVDLNKSTWSQLEQMVLYPTRFDNGASLAEAAKLEATRRLMWQLEQLEASVKTSGRRLETLTKWLVALTIVLALASVALLVASVV
jgi:hypothetical protein